MEFEKKNFSFTHCFNCPNEKFDVQKGWEVQELNVRVKVNGDRLVFYLTLPKYIYDRVLNCDKEYLEEHEEGDGFFKKIVKFRNEISDTTLYGLVSKFNKICRDAVFFQHLEDADKSKVICVNFSSNEVQKRGAFNHANMGNLLSSSFQFFTCFKIDQSKDFFPDKRAEYQDYTAEKLDGIGENLYLRRLRIHDDGMENKFTIIEWSEDREQFLRYIEGQFRILNKKLDDFFANINNEGIDKLIGFQFAIEYKNANNKQDKKDIED